jgi:hypothetical protein
MSTDKRKVLKPLKEMETIWHPESTLVFKSKTEKVVTGRWINSEFLPFDEEAVELCSQWSFKYDQELYNELMAEEEEEGSDEVEGETEEGDVPAGDEVVGEGDDVVGEGDDVVGEGDVQAGDEVEDVSGEVETVVSNDDLNNLTSNFTNNLNSYFQKLSNDYCAKISDLETKLAKMTEDRDKIKDMYSSVKEECDKLKAKFEGFKSFFMA